MPRLPHEYPDFKCWNTIKATPGIQFPERNHLKTTRPTPEVLQYWSSLALPPWSTRCARHALRCQSWLASFWAVGATAVNQSARSRPLRQSWIRSPAHRSITSKRCLKTELLAMRLQTSPFHAMPQGSQRFAPHRSTRKPQEIPRTTLAFSSPRTGTDAFWPRATAALEAESTGSTWSVEPPPPQQRPPCKAVYLRNHRAYSPNTDSQQCPRIPGTALRRLMGNGA